MGWIKTCAGKLIDVGEADSPTGRALLEERYRALLKQIPLIYVVAIANFLGLHLASGGAVDSLFSPSTLLLGLVVVRLVHWLRARNRVISPERMLRELRKTWFYALIVSIGFSVWAIHLLREQNADYDG